MALPKDERMALTGLGPFVLRERELPAPARTKKPAVIGVQFMGDLFHASVPDEFIDQVFEEIGFHGIHHTFLILTKRPQRMAEYFKRLQTVASHPLNPFPNVYSGLTVCNQQEADEKIPIFLQVPGKKFLSIEPMLGKIDLSHYLWFDGTNGEWFDEYSGGYKGKPEPCYDPQSPFDAVILGGETGPGARPMHPDWVRSVRDQCQSAGVPFFFKNWGYWIPVEELGTCRVEKNKTHSRILDMETHDSLPWVTK